MSPDTKPKPAGEEETPSSASRKTTSGRPHEPALKCPRCDSPNTKFCYYNNYSLTQPRHFCKTCRRYWTKGGALRSVPIGGGCRKNKKMKSSQRLSGDSNGSSSDIGGLKFFQGISPAMDFQLGGMSVPRVHSSSSPALFNQFSHFGDLSNTSCAISSNPCLNLDPSATNPPPLVGFAFPLSSTMKQGDQMGSLNLHTSLASSIESLSSINQDLHWILQKQRLSMLFDNQKDGNSLSSIQPTIVQKPQPILFQNLEIAKADHQSCEIKTTPRKDGGTGNLSTEWFFDNSYGAVNETPATSSSNVNENTSSWSGIQAWSDLSQYSSLP